LAASRCRDAASPGITRGFPRLCPSAGLVTVALLTLTPLALRPVRLACLIHAANVHSEPGSNPSRWGRRRDAPHSSKSEESDILMVAAGPPEGQIPRTPRDSLNRPARPRRLATSRPGTGRIHAGSPRGSLNTLACTQTIDRIVKGHREGGCTPDAIGRSRPP